MEELKYAQKYANVYLIYLCEHSGEYLSDYKFHINGDDKS